MECPQCKSDSRVQKNGRDGGSQQYVCRFCPENGGKHRYFREEHKPKKEPMTEELGISEDQFRLRHDTKYQVQQACLTLKKGRFLAQPEFMRLAKVKPSAGYRAILDDPDFDKYRGKASGGIIYWSHPEGIQNFKDKGTLE